MLLWCIDEAVKFLIGLLKCHWWKLYAQINLVFLADYPPFNEFDSRIVIVGLTYKLGEGVHVVLEELLIEVVFATLHRDH